MRWTPTLIALGLLAVTVPLASNAAASHGTCLSLVGASPVGPPQDAVGTIRLCDDNGDGAPDTVKTETYPFYTKSHASVYQEDTVSSDGQDERVHGEVMVAAGGPLDPLVYQRATVLDRGDDETIDMVENEGVVDGAGEVDQRARYFLGAWDLDGDGLPNAWGFLVCAVDSCAAPNPAALPLPGASDAPNIEFYVTGVGWIP